MDLILYGAGKIGHRFIESECFRELNYNQVYFYDNNKDLPRYIGKIERIDKLETADGKAEIIITCAAWNSVYDDCVLKGYRNIRIYDEKTEKVYSIKEYCKVYATAYMNEKHVIYINEKRHKIALGKETFLQTHNLFNCMTEVAIMLSNLCNYALIHPKCPANCVKEKQIMPSNIVYKILDELAENAFAGTICFHIYNEPLIDPRLFLFIQYAKKVMPNCFVRIYSNGYYLNQVMVEELEEIGTDVLVTTGYGKQEYERLIDLNVKIPFSIILGNLDDRLDFYTTKNSRKAISNDICNSYIAQIPIYSDGNIGTCCLDYKHPYGLGNIMNASLEECLNDNKIVDFQLRLCNGDRSMFPICANCAWQLGYE